MVQSTTRMTLEDARAQFPVLERCAYLNAGSVGPLPRVSAEALEVWQRRELVEGRGSLSVFMEAMELRNRVRARVAKLIAAPADRVALTYSTTDGCNIVLRGLELGPGDEIVTTDVEHFGLIGPVHASGARVRVAAVRDRPAGEALTAILAEVTPRTRLLALSHVAWTTGHVLPIADLKRETDLPVLVDGAQSVGAIPVEASTYDFYTVSGQKWLCGPFPTGALYVADPERLRVGSPSYLSQASYHPDGSFEPTPGAARFDSGWVPPGFLAGLEAAIDAAPEWRFEHMRAAAARCRELLAAAGLEVVTEADHAALVSFRPRDDPRDAALRLLEQGIVVRDLPGTGWLRASCGYWTSDEDLERLVDGLST